MLTTLWDWPSPVTAHTIWCLGVDHTYPSTFTSLWCGAQRNTSMLITTLLRNVNDCKKPSRKQKCSQHQRLRDRSDTTIEWLMLFHWNQVTWSWLKPILTKGGRKWGAGGRRNCTKWNAELLRVSLHTSWRTSRQDAHESSTKTDFCLFSPNGYPPLYGYAGWVGKVCHCCPRGTNSWREWDWGCATKCELSAAHPARDSWDSSRLGEQEALCIPLDIYLSVPAGSTVKILM